MLTVTDKAEATSVVTLDELKDHLAISGTQDDARLAGVLAASVDYCERAVTGGRSIVETSYLLQLGGWPRRAKDNIWLPKPPLMSVESVSYYDADNEAQELDPENDYAVIGIGSESQGWLELLQPLPQTYCRSDAVSIEYTAGYETLPATLRAAILLLCGHLNEHRESVITGTIASELPQGLTALLGLNGWGYFPGGG